nr:hypothetical protein [uncultured Caproiciproducens sp.]
MEQEKNMEITEFRSLMAAIRTESALLGKVILAEDEAKEESKILSEFDNTVQAQVFGTLNHLVGYQLAGWMDLIDDGDDGDDIDGTDPAQN